MSNIPGEKMEKSNVVIWLRCHQTFDRGLAMSNGFKQSWFEARAPRGRLVVGLTLRRVEQGSDPSYRLPF